MATLIYGPAETTVPGGTATPPHVFLTRVFNTGDVITMGFASASPDAGVSRSDFDWTVDRDAVSSSHVINRDCHWSETSVAFSYTVPSPQTLVFRTQGGGSPPDSSHGVMHGAFVQVEEAAVVHCQYGTRIKTGGAPLVTVTPDTIAGWAAATGLQFLAQLLTSTWYSVLDATSLCGQGPPPLDPADFQDASPSAAQVLKILHAMAWPNLCECIPGTPVPFPFPPPTATQPPGWPTVPVFPCSNVDPCAALIAIQQQLAAVQQALSSNLELTTLLQRYGLPFAFIPGATHSDIHVSGSFAVSRLAGVSVTVTERPGTEATFTGVPPYVSDLGWLSILTGDGLIDEIRLTRDHQLWFPKLMPLAVQLGIGLRDGVRINVQELQAEP